jgi:transcriptional regulator with XRE-family HTH domain
MALDELREARAMTQVHLAKVLGVNQAAVSKLERRADMYVSTLHDFIKAMGGELKITARFPEGTVEINQFEAVKKRPNAPDALRILNRAGSEEPREGDELI